jgi:FtsP/CotA-like multicopper oxidase with cupredoxin domain
MMPVAKRLPLLLVVLLCASSAARRSPPPPLVPNDNTKSAGVLRDGTLTLELMATEGTWPRDAGQLNRATVEAFAERGKAPTVPSPFVRVPIGTNIRVTVHNALSRRLAFFLPTSASADDSILVAPGESGVIAVRAAAAGNFIYRGMTSSDSLTPTLGVAGALAGAIVVDTAGASRTPRDRVLVLMMTPDSSLIAAGPLGATTDIRHMAFTINGRSWPNTERVAATVGDTVRWRVINATFDVHPMHLHGFYYRVDSLTGPLVARQGQGAPGRMVVTERMSPYSAMNMTWVPERAGNWLFHCHVALHLEPPDAPGSSGHMMPDMKNHAVTGMVGLVLGINVAPRAREVTLASSKPVRQLRLIATSDAGYPDSMPSYRFTIEEKGRVTTAHVGISPSLYLTRGEPVAITVVNRLKEPTGVHWHGMELESYFDGVAGLSGTAKRLAPMIAPGDSFVARFTPPRAGTFMYHSHVDDVRQQAAGLVGPMIVRDGPPTPKPDEYELMLKGSRGGTYRNNALEVNGLSNPDTIVAHVGRPMRLRIMASR